MDPLKVTQKLGQFLFYCDKCNNKLIRWDSWEQDPNRTCSGCQPAEGSAKDPAKDYVATSPEPGFAHSNKMPSVFLTCLCSASPPPPILFLRIFPDPGRDEIPPLKRHLHWGKIG